MERIRIGKRRFWIKSLLVCVAILLVGGFVAWKYADQIAKGKLIETLSDTTGLATHVDDVHVTTTGITASQLVIGDPAAPALAAERLQVVAPLGDLIGGNPSISTIRVESAKLRLSVDEHGQVIWPFKSGEQSGLPADRIELTNASLLMTQTGREPLSVEGVDLTIDKKGTGFTLAGEITKLLDSKWLVSGQVDSDGKSRIELKSDSIAFDSRELSKLVLVPDSVKAVTAIVDGGVEIELTKDGTDAGPQIATRLSNANVQLPQVKLNLSETAVKIDIAGDLLHVQELNAKLGAGTLTADATFAIGGSNRGTGEFQGRLDRVGLSDVQSTFSIPENIDGLVTAKYSGHLKVADSGEVTVDLAGEGIVNDGVLDGIRALPINATVHLDKFQIGPSGKREIQGEVKLSEVQFEKQPVKTIASVFGEAQVPIDGHISGTGTLTLPLHTIADIGTWNAAANVSSTDLAWSGIRPQKTAATIAFSEGLLRVSQFTAKLDDEQSATGTVSWPLAGHQPATIQINGGITANQLTATVLPDAKIDQLTGNVSYDAALQFTPNTLDTPDTWTGHLKVAAPALSYGELAMNDVAIGGTIGNGEIRLSQSAMSVGKNGRVSVDGRVPFVGEEPVDLRFKANHFQLTELANIASRINLDVRNSLQQFDQGNLPDGLLTADGTVSIAGKNLSRPDQWDIIIKTKVTDLKLSGLAAQSATGTFEISDGLFTISNADVQMVGGGRLQGTGFYPLKGDAANTRTQANLTWTAFPLSLLSPASDRLQNKDQVSGTTSGKLSLHSERLPVTLKSLIGQGTIAFQETSVTHVQLGNISGNVRLQNGRLSLQELQTSAQNMSAEHAAKDQTPVLIPVEKAIPLRGGIAVDLFAPYQFQANVALNDEPLDKRLAQLLPPSMPGVSGFVSLSADVQGSLEPQKIVVNGKGTLRELQIGEQQLSDVNAKFSNVEQRTDRVQLNVTALDGKFLIVADLPNSTVDNKLISAEATNIDFTQLSAIANLQKHDLELNGRLNGKVLVTAWDNPMTRDVSLEVAGASGTFAGIPLTELTANGKLQQDRVTINVSGKALDGEIKIDGTSQLTAASEGTIPLQVHWHAAKLQGFGNSAAQYAHLRPLAGVGNLDLKLQLSVPDFKAVGTGTVELREVQWDRQRVTRSATSNLSINDRRVRLSGLNAAFARGVIRGRVDWPLSRNGTGTYDLTAQRIDVARVVEMQPRGMPRTSGFINARLSGSIGNRITGRGEVTVDRFASGGFSTRSLVLPIAYSVSRQNLNGSVTLRRAAARLGTGTITSDGTVEFGHRLNIELTTKLAQVDSADLFQSRVNQGQLSGTLKLSGTGIRSFNDVNGRFLGDLEKSSVLQLPVFSDLANFVNIGSFNRGSFDSSKIDLRLAKGVISTTGIALESSRAEVFVRGRVYANQRLDLDVALQTGNISPDFGLLELAGSPIAVLSVPGVAIVAQALDFLSNRVIYVHVGGTIRSPNFRLKTGQILQDVLLRYYLPAPQYQQILRNR